MRALKFRERFNGSYHFWGWVDDRFVPPLTSGKASEKSSEQYTGFKDKGGKEIYDGDILKHDLWGHTQVVWEHGMFRGQNGKDWNDMIDATLADHQLSRCRVVGNIYDNPELLEGKD